MNISETTIKAIELDYHIHFYDDYINLVEPKKATGIHVSWELKDGQPVNLIGKTIKTPKKMEITYEWLMAKLNKESIYNNFCEYFNQFLKTLDLRGYPASYGIGVGCIYNRKLKEHQTAIEGELDRLGIKYSTEYSDAHWIYRYRISQSRENIDRIKSVVES